MLTPWTSTRRDLNPLFPSTFFDDMPLVSSTPRGLMGDWGNLLNMIPRDVRSDFNALSWPTDIRETDDALIFHCDACGIPKSDIEVTIENGILKMEGQRKSLKEEGIADDTFHRVERQYGSFSRSFRLPSDADLDGRNLQAKLEHGELTVVVPKLVTKTPGSSNVKRITIE